MKSNTARMARSGVCHALPISEKMEVIDRHQLRCAIACRRLTLVKEHHDCLCPAWTLAYPHCSHLHRAGPGACGRRLLALRRGRHRHAGRGRAGVEGAAQRPAFSGLAAVRHPDLVRHRSEVRLVAIAAAPRYLVRRRRRTDGRRGRVLASTTGGGVAFLSSTLDYTIRGYDVRNGKTVWKARLPAGGQATPMSYVSDKTGKQYVVVMAGGHGSLGTKMGDSLVAFALPEGAVKGK